MGYRDKPDLYLRPPTREERRQKYYILWLFPMILLGPNIGRIADTLGFKATHEIALYGTIFMGLVCVVGAIISYKSARKTAARDLEELTDPKKR